MLFPGPSLIGSPLLCRIRWPLWHDESREHQSSSENRIMPMKRSHRWAEGILQTGVSNMEKLPAGRSWR